jgi:hypothetical protein
MRWVIRRMLAGPVHCMGDNASKPWGNPPGFLISFARMA